ncbi:MAG: exodeoxyribonuclease VII large subunit [Candidatus Omnitrophica bacterium]|nr:exodeoxyribonuclease VII large subunit [Candidatus Omnitrophota bacterium]
MAKEFLRVSELNQLIQDVIHAGFPQPLWICGEIQGFNRNRSKNHIFFELVEKDPDSKNIIAKIGLVLFAGRKAHVQDILRRSENAFALKDDIEVKFACSIDFYPPHGAIRLIVESIDPIYTLGKLAQEKQKLITLLKKKGILDKNKQRELPLVPLRAGLITADDSAAYNDFCSELQRGGFAFQLYLRNALMQGSKTEGDVCKALDELSKIEGLDVIIITRGGGSIADLSYFDSQKIAERIAGCPLPVLSGIGHEINISITDMAAHTYAKTPTAIAQFLVNRVQVFLDELEEKMEQVTEGAQEKIEEEKQRLKNYAIDLQDNTRSYLKGHGQKIIRLQEIIRQRSVLLLKNYSRSLADIQNAVKRVTRACLSNNCVKLSSYQRMIDNFHPSNTIKRGFSITRTKDGKAVKNISSVHLKEELVTEIADGLIISEVGRIKKMKFQIPNDN